MEELLFIFLKAGASKLGPQAVQTIENALLGKQTSLDDISKLITALQESINELPALVNHRIVQQKYKETLSRALHNTDHKNYKALLEFLDDSRADSYWAIVNATCLDMFDISARTMEQERNTPNKIDFAGKNGVVQTVNRDIIQHLQLVDDYLKAITSNAIMLSAAVVAVTHVATEALKVVGACPRSNPYYRVCRKRYTDPITRQYLPLTSGGKPGEKGLPYLLAPAIKEAPRAIVGNKLAEVYEGMCAGGGKVTFCSARFDEDDKGKWYVPLSEDSNPWLKKDEPTTWTLMRWYRHPNKLLIFHGARYIYFAGGAVFTNGTYNDSNYFHWYIRKVDRYGIVHMFAATGDSGDKYLISTKNAFGFYAMDVSGTIDYYENYWYLW